MDLKIGAQEHTFNGTGTSQLNFVNNSGKGRFANTLRINCMQADLAYPANL
jgi:hypothetical protein